jgi:long-chain acyl-CoA synthetase
MPERPDRSISYAELDAASNRVANLLIERGVRPGDKVALSCPNIPQFTTIYFGIIKAGAVVVQDLRARR